MTRRVLLVAGGTVATLALLFVVAVLAIVASGPGHAVARRLAVRALEGAVDGRVTIGSLRGSLWRAAELRDVQLATPDGHPVIRVGRVSVRYALADLARRRYVLTRVELDRPTLVIETMPDGHLNLERLFRLLGPRGGPSGPRPLVELRSVRVSDGTVVLRERPDSSKGGVVRERRFLGLSLSMTRLLASSPDTGGVAADLRHLAVTVSDPAVRVEDAVGRVVIRGDSARFDLSRLALPGSEGRAKGVVRWGGTASAGRATVDVEGELPRASFADFRWVVGGLPETGGGSVTIHARLYPGGRDAITLSDADLTTGRSHVTGSADFELGGRREAVIHNLDANAMPLDPAVLAPFLGPMPVAGLVRGHLTATGVPARLAAGADLWFSDEKASGRPDNHVTGAGTVSVGGRDGLAFHRFALTSSDLAMASIAEFAPSITLRGRLALSGSLDGPWRDASFDGTMTHRDGDGPASSVRGTARLTLADTVRVDADVVADSLSLDDLARSFPSLPLRGTLAGPVRVRGPVTALAIETDLAGPRGALTARGSVSSQADDLSLEFSGSMDSVDLAPRLSGAPATRLNGRWRARLVLPPAGDSAPVRGSVGVSLFDSRVAGVDLARAGAAVTLTAARLEVDTAYLEQPGLSFRAYGALGRAGQPAGQLSFTAHADTLANLAELAAWLRALGGDTATGRLALRGAGRADGRIVGTTDVWEVQGNLVADSVAYGPLAVAGGRASGTVSRSGAPGTRGWAFGLRLAAGSLAVAGMHYSQVRISAEGPLDSLRLSAAGAFPLGSSAQADLVLGLDSTRWQARVEKAELALPRGHWALVRPVRLVGTAAGIAVDTLEVAGEGGARVMVAGRVPGASPGDLTAAADSVPLTDVYALLEADTTGIGGVVSGAVHLLGTAAAPKFDGTASLSDGRFGDFRAPLVEAAFDYADRRLGFRGSLRRNHATVVTASGSLPLDLALAEVERRQVAGPLEIRVRADSVDLAVADALTSLVRGVSGHLDADFTVGGTWEQPELEGSARIQSGAAVVPALGARYAGIDARLALSGDRLTVEQARVGGGPGALDIGGDVRFESLTRPVLNLTLTARSFAAFTQRDFAGLTASGTMSLTGPLLGATLRGRVTVDAGFLAFADLVEKRIINLDDPEFRSVVDSSLASAGELGPTASNIFLDSLRIEPLTVVLGPDVWLRSHEANIQLAGEFTVVRDVEGGIARYRLDGTLRAVRGTYRLVVGPTGKEFRVTRGTVRFFGTPDFNPELDIVAEHTVRAVRGNELVVRAVIGGTLMVPRLTLESDQRPPLSETEIVSYLLFGRPSADLTTGGAGAGASGSEQAIFQGALVGLAGALSGELEQTLVSGLGIPVDYIAIRPGGGSVGDIFGSTRVEAGTQIGEKTFLTLNAGLCQVSRGLSSQVLGASVEYRLTHRWSVEASIEPTAQECRPVGFQIRPPVPYQIGMDLFWQLGAP